MYAVAYPSYAPQFPAHVTLVAPFLRRTPCCGCYIRSADGGLRDCRTGCAVLDYADLITLRFIHVTRTGWRFAVHRVTHPYYCGWTLPQFAPVCSGLRYALVACGVGLPTHPLPLPHGWIEHTRALPRVLPLQFAHLGRTLQLIAVRLPAGLFRRYGAVGCAWFI